MDGQDRDLGWEDVGGHSAAGATGQMGSFDGVAGMPGVSDAVTSAMVSHFQREIMKNSMSMWPKFMVEARRYFNVTHGYVARKALWQIVPMPNPKKKALDGEILAEKDWTSRMYDGLEVEIEEPDMYIPVMGFVTYVVLCAMLRGLQDEFTPEVLSATISFAFILLFLEVTIAKAVLYMGGAVNAPVLDIAALLGYKYFYLSIQIILGFILGFGRQPDGFIYKSLALGLAGSCSVSLWQALRKLARMQPGLGQECQTEIHKIFIQVMPATQAVLLWLLMPKWPARLPAAVVVATKVPAAVVAATKVVAAVATQLPTVAAVAASVVAAVTSNTTSP